jgi:hypothetical protein
MELLSLPGPQHVQCIVKESYRFELKIRMAAGDKKCRTMESVEGTSPEEIISLSAKLISKYPAWYSWILHHVITFEAAGKTVEDVDYIDSGFSTFGDPDSDFLKIVKQSKEFNPVAITPEEKAIGLPEDKNDRFVLYQHLLAEFGEDEGDPMSPEAQPPQQ